MGLEVVDLLLELAKRQTQPEAESPREALLTGQALLEQLMIGRAQYFEEDDIVKKNNFFVKTENGYELYMNGTYIGTLDEIPNELKNIKIRRK